MTSTARVTVELDAQQAGTFYRTVLAKLKPGQIVDKPVPVLGGTATIHCITGAPGVITSLDLVLDQAAVGSLIDAVTEGLRS